MFLRIGTRKSPLALAQAELVRARLMAAHPSLSVELVTMDTAGDKITDRNLSEIGGKGLFTKEIEDGLLDGSLDIAVHSMKDMPAQLPEGLEISCILEREDPRDAFISVKYPSIEALPNQAVVGTSSIRRAIQLLSIRPDIKIIPFRGNVGTRLKKLEAGEADATFLAVAGLKRLNLPRAITAIIPTEVMLPAVAQGAIGIECRADNAKVKKLLAPLDHAETFTVVTAERAVLKAIEGSCRTPLAALASVEKGRITVRALLADETSYTIYRAEGEGKVAEEVGAKVGAALKKSVTRGP